eukprot:364148-Chlamydomonas_euryale.AAC.1
MASGRWKAVGTDGGVTLQARIQSHAACLFTAPPIGAEDGSNKAKQVQTCLRRWRWRRRQREGCRRTGMERRALVAPVPLISSPGASDSRFETSSAGMRQPLPWAATAMGVFPPLRTAGSPPPSGLQLRKQATAPVHKGTRDTLWWHAQALAPSRQCVDCGACETPQWRQGPAGEAGGAIGRDMRQGTALSPSFLIS